MPRRSGAGSGGARGRVGSEARRRVEDVVERGREVPRPGAPQPGQVRDEFREYASRQLGRVEQAVVDFVEQVLADRGEMTEVLALTSLFEHLVLEGLEAVGGSIDGLSDVARTPVAEIVGNLAASVRADVEERKRRLEERVAEFREQLRRGLPEPGPVLTRIQSADLSGLRLPTERLEGLPGGDRIQFLVASADRLMAVVGRPRRLEEVTIDIEAVESLVGELADRAGSVVAEQADRLAVLAGRVHEALKRILTQPVQIPGVSEAYGFLTATPSQPRGRPLTLLGAICFSFAREVVRESEEGASPLPLATIDSLIGVRLRSFAVGPDAVAAILRDAAARPLDVGGRSSPARPGPPRGLTAEQLELLARAIVWLDYRVKRSKAQRGLRSKDGPADTALDVVGLVTSYLRGPFLETLAVASDLEAIRNRQTLGPGPRAGLVAVAFKWLGWLLSVVSFDVKTATGDTKTTVPFIISGIGVLTTYSNLGSFVAASARIAIERSATPEGALGLVLGYLEDQTGALPDALALLEEPSVIGGTSGTSLAIYEVVDKVAPWVEVGLLKAGIELSKA